MFSVFLGQPHTFCMCIPTQRLENRLVILTMSVENLVTRWASAVKGPRPPPQHALFEVYGVRNSACASLAVATYRICWFTYLELPVEEKRASGHLLASLLRSLLYYNKNGAKRTSSRLSSNDGLLITCRSRRLILLGMITSEYPGGRPGCREFEMQDLGQGPRRGVSIR